jgi:hypothetical protein
MPDRPLRVLIIEDDEPVAQTIKDSIEEKIPSHCFIEGSFERALEVVGPQFDVVILDQLKGPQPDRDLAARPVWKYIYEEVFVPVIVYSATELALEEGFPLDNPILVHIAKGQNSEEKLINHIVSHSHIYLGLKTLKRELSGVTRDVFLKVKASRCGDESQTSCTRGASSHRSDDGLSNINRRGPSGVGAIYMPPAIHAVVDGRHPSSQCKVGQRSFKLSDNADPIM